MVARKLFVVQDTILIKGRGVAALPGIVPEGEERFRVGEPIILKRPDGTELNWQIGGLELMHTPRPRGDIVVLLQGLSKEDVPLGTEIWSVDALALDRSL